MSTQTIDQPQIAAPAQEVKTSWVRRIRAQLFRRRVLMALGFGIGTWLLLQWLPSTERRALAASIFANRAIIISLFLFSGVTLSLLWTVGQDWDAWAFSFFNVHGFRARWLDWTMWLATQLGNGGVAIAMAAVLYFNGFRRLAIELTLGVLTLWFVVETIKALTDRARPFARLADVRIIGWRALGRSFPSGHTAQAFFLASLLVHYFDIIPWVGWTLYVLAGLVGVTRMYVGAHYPRDVLAGGLLGFVWGILATLVDPYLWPLPA